MRRSSRPPAGVVIVSSYLVGAVPFSGLVARAVRGVDLREVGSGTVSGTGLFRIAGLGPLLLGGILDLAKGAVGPALAGDDRPGLRAAAAAAAVIGHDWSIFLGGAGGRGISPAMGALVVGAPEGAVALLGGLALGKAAGATSVGALLAAIGLVPLLARTRGRDGAMLAGAVVAPMLVKRILGNRPPPPGRRPGVYLVRLVFDQDDPPWTLESSGGTSA